MLRGHHGRRLLSRSREVFSQLFDNADGSGATGGTTDNPIGLDNIQISGGALRGVSSPNSRGANHRVYNVLNDALTGGAVVTFDAQFDPMINSEFIVVRFNAGTDFTTSEVCQFFIGVGSAAPYFVYVRDDSNNVVGTMYSSGTKLPVSIISFEFTIDLTSKTVSVTSDSGLLADVFDLDISDGGSMTETEIKSVSVEYVSNLAFDSTLDNEFDNLKIFALP